MASIFRKLQDVTGKPNRNTFDGSFVNNLTTKFGQITPCCVIPVLPGDTHKIDLTFGFNLMPTTFPVQTRIRADVHFFYVRNRALWKGWQDWITKTENRDGDNTPPYILLNEENRDMFDTGKIGDYLGVPSVFYSQGYVQLQSKLSGYPLAAQTSDAEYGSSTTYAYAIRHLTNRDGSFIASALDGNPVNGVSADMDSALSRLFFRSYYYTDSNGDNQVGVMQESRVYPLPWLTNRTEAGASPSQFISFIRQADLIKGSVGVSLNWFTVYHNYLALRDLDTLAIDGFETGPLVNLPYYYAVLDLTKNTVIAHFMFENFEYSAEGDITITVMSASNSEVISYTSTGGINFNIPEEYQADDLKLVFGRVANTLYGTSSVYNTPGDTVYQVVDGRFGIENKDRPLESLPFEFVGDAERSTSIRISALPFRAVEACYNSFYRDIRNNPLIENGKPLYNVYTLNTSGGADPTHYKLYQRNWQDDYLTTAVQSPQQGVAPLVGVTASGNMTFQDEAGKTYYLQAEFDEDGETITGIKSYSSDMPVGTLRAMVDTISTGISINDFRNVNALQRWLEKNMRKGLRYKDQLEAHFGVSPTYSELDIPEFIGGMSRDVNMNRVVQSSESANTPLGTLAGNGSVLGSGGQSISKFCDEHGYIIGFVTFSPVPVYSQQLNKDLMKTELLDYYFPEFAHIGFQPILNKEVAPLQCSDEQLDEVFGYQRAWYEYLERVDEVHGDFRSSLKDYIISRKFSSVPQLGEEFLTINQDDANDIFAVRKDEEDTDKIFGQMYFDIKMKRPIPEYGIPKLEVE